MKILRAILSIILTIVLIASIIVYTVLASARDTVLKKESVINALSKSDISKDVTKAVDETMDKSLNTLEREITEQVRTSLAESTNNQAAIDAAMKAPEVQEAIQTAKGSVADVLKYFNTEENINSLFEFAVKVFYEQEEFSEENNVVKDMLQGTIDSITKEHNIKLTEEAKVEVDKFVNELSTELNNQFIESMKEMSDADEDAKVVKNPVPEFINKVGDVTLVVLGVVLVIMIILLVLHIKCISKGLKYIAIALLVTGIFITIIGRAALSVDILKFLELENDSIGTFFMSIFEDIIKVLTGFGITYIAFGVVIIVVIVVAKIILKKQKDKPEVVS